MCKVSKKRKHYPCKPGSDLRQLGRATLSRDGLHELAAPSRHSPMITHWLVVSYTTFSPLPPRKGRRSFSSAFTYCHQ